MWHLLFQSGFRSIFLSEEKKKYLPSIGFEIFDIEIIFLP